MARRNLNDLLAFVAVAREGSFTRAGAVLGVTQSALSQAIDSVIFITLAFYGEFDIKNLLIGQVLAKVALSFVLVPPLIALGVGLARKLDAAQFR